MTKKLYLVEKKAYVMAENELEAGVIDTGDGASVEVLEALSVDSDWWDLIPFGGDDDNTCGQILTQQRAAK